MSYFGIGGLRAPLCVKMPLLVQAVCMQPWWSLFTLTGSLFLCALVFTHLPWGMEWNGTIGLDFGI